MRRQKLASESQDESQHAVKVNDDGELQDIVFCLHCHKANDPAATECKFCHQPIIEPPSDLRDRLQRISQQASHREPARQRDRVMQSIEELPEATAQSIKSLRQMLTSGGSGIVRMIRGLLIRLVYWALDRIEYLNSQLFERH